MINRFTFYYISFTGNGREVLSTYYQTREKFYRYYGQHPSFEEYRPEIFSAKDPNMAYKNYLEQHNL